MCAASPSLSNGSEMVVGTFLFAFQASCIPCILSGSDVVVAAETGSGKTHGYLVPLMEKLCTVPDSSVNSTMGGEMNIPHRLSLVLCPNVMLCEQVVRMANGLCDDMGKPLLSVAAVCGQQVLTVWFSFPHSGTC